MSYRFNPFTGNLDYYLSTDITGNISPSVNATYSLGSASNYYSNLYANRLNLNSTAYLDGGTSGQIFTTAWFAANSPLANTPWYSGAGGAVASFKGSTAYNQNQVALLGEIDNVYAGSRGQYNPVTGLAFQVLNNVGQSLYSGYGTDVVVGVNAPNATITDAVGSYSRVQVSDNTGQSITNFYSFRPDIINFTTGGKTCTITNFYGLYMGDSWYPRNNGVPITNLYGVYIDDTYAKNWLAGELKIGGNIGFYGTTPASKPTVTGAKGGNAALASLLTSLASLGLITDSTT